MSTRYVWEKFTRDEVTIDFSVFEASHHSVGSDTGDARLYACSSYSVSLNKSTGKISLTPSGTVEELTGRGQYISASGLTYGIAVFNNPAINDAIIKKTSNVKYWIVDYIVGLPGSMYLTTAKQEGIDTVAPTSTSYVGFPKFTEISEGKVSSGSSNAYPDEAYSGNYYYKYLGNDNIDPYSISYATSIEYQGAGNLTKLPYTITPSKRNQFGGVIEYSVEYNKDSAGWQGGETWNTNTTGNRSNFTPGSKYQFRVRARDRWGFTSTTYATGPVCTVVSKKVISLFVSPENGGTTSGGGEYSENTSVTVTAIPANGWEFVAWTENGTTVSTSALYTFTVTTSRNLTAVFKQKLAVWIGVNGKARKGMELYVGVNGKARKVTAAYIGVNGKARRFL